MAESTSPPVRERTDPIAVVSRNLHSPYPKMLIISNTELSLNDGGYEVYAKDKVIFNFKFKSSFFGPRVLLDADGNTILTFVQKKLTFGTKWIVFRGNSTKSNDIIFCTKRSSDIYPEQLDVFMGDEETEDYCDFKIKGNWFDQSCTIYGTDGFTSIPGNPDIAKMIMMNPKHQSIGQEKFGVLIYPEVDHAFIVALVLIMKLTRDIDLRKHCSHGW